MKLFFILFLIPLLANAKPTAESLFRNGANKDIGQNSIALKMKFETIENESIKENFVKFYLIQEREDVFDLFQIVYPTAEMNDAEITSVKMVGNVREKIKKIEQESLEKNFFWSAFYSLYLNQSMPMASLIKRFNGEFKLASELINREKVDLLHSYRRYLVASKDKSDLANPIKPDSTLDQERVKKILYSNYFLDDENVVLRKDKDQFFWSIQMSNFQADFGHEDNKIYRIYLNNSRENYEIVYSEYILFAGVFELPKISVLKIGEDKKIRITLLSLDLFPKTKNNTLRTKSQEYEQKAKEKKIFQAAHGIDVLY